jgi:transposase
MMTTEEKQAVSKLVNSVDAGHELLQRKEAQLSKFAEDQAEAEKHASAVARLIHDVAADPAITVESIRAKIASHSGAIELLGDMAKSVEALRQKLAAARGVNMGRSSGPVEPASVKAASETPRSETYHPGLVAMAERLGVPVS